MRIVEVEWNAGSISGSLQSSEAITTTQTNRRIEEDRDGTQQMVSSVIVNERGSSFYGLESLSENVVDIRQLDGRWRGLENFYRHVIRCHESENEESLSEDYLTTFTFPENVIVVRSIRDFRQPYDYSTQTQVIWNSRFTWPEIKQHIEDNTYNFHFSSEIIAILTISFGFQDPLQQDEVPVDEEIPNSLLEAVDGLPEVQICNESENDDDGDICPICHDAFSSVEPAKQLRCKHQYHSKCIIPWVRQKNSCPTSADVRIRLIFIISS